MRSQLFFAAAFVAFTWGMQRQHGDPDYDWRDVDPATAAQYRRLSRQRRLTPEEREALSTAQLGPRVHLGPVLQTPQRPRHQALTSPVLPRVPESWQYEGVAAGGGDGEGAS
eukprot:3276764-Karenia_brevis.AAC.1